MTGHLLHRAAPIIAGLVLLAANGCGGSASTNVLGPSASKCDISVTNSVPNVPSAGGTGQVTVATNRECSWTARADAAWITLASSEGQGPASLTYTVAVNPAAAPRQGSVVVGEQRVAVLQQAAPCRYEATPASRDAAGAGEQIAVSLATLAGCAWTAQSDAGWIGVAPPAAGQGSASVLFDVAPNPGDVRSGTVNIAGQLVRINQAARTQPSPAPPAPGPAPIPPAPPTCSYAVSPLRRTAAAAGEAVTFDVTAASGCSWMASSNAAWLNVAAGASGSGAGSVRVIVSANTGAARSGTLTIAGQSVTLEQAGAAAPTPPACSYNLAPTNRSTGRDDAVVTIAVSAPDHCAWTAASQATWITVTDGRSGAGNGTVQLAVAANGGPSRSGTVLVAGRTFTVQQDGAACSYSIKPGSYRAGRRPDDVQVSVTAGEGCAWATSNSASWISVVEGRTGTGNGTVRLLVEANNGAGRTASLTIAGHPFTLEQLGCETSIKPTNYHSGRGPDDIRIAVTADAGCTWTATSPVSWVTVVEGQEGSGTGTVRLRVHPNNDDARSTILTIAGHPFTLRQDGAK